MKINLPTEILENIAVNLSNHQQYVCLTVCRSWYLPFRRVLYKVIFIRSKRQLRLLFLNLQSNHSHRHLIRQFYLYKSTRTVSGYKSKTRSVGITYSQLNNLAELCPFLQVLDFDPEIWKYISFPKKLFCLNYLEQLPPFTTRRILLPLLRIMGYKLTYLGLQGKLVTDLYEDQQLIPLLISLSRLKQLYISTRQPRSHVITVTLKDIEMIHDSLPEIEELEIDGSVNMLMNYSKDTPQQMRMIRKALNLQKLKLRATVSPQWIYYWAYKYPNLQELDMETIDTVSTYIADFPERDTENNRMNTKEIQGLFSMLISSCTQLRMIQLDSLTAKYYMSQSFFDCVSNRSNSLYEIKMTKLPYNLVSRTGFFDILAQNGQNLVSGFGTEVIGSDAHITAILSPLVSFTKLTDLVLCCGHPDYDCEIDLILNHCRKLKHLIIRSAHVIVNSLELELHPLEYLSLGSVSFSPLVFEYLGQRCRSLNQLVFYECDQRSTSETVTDRIKIYMPYNKFESISMNGVRLDSVPLSSHAWVPNSRILSITESDRIKNKTRWYHVYNSSSCYPSHSRIQRLNKKKENVARDYYYEHQYHQYHDQHRLISKIDSSPVYRYTRSSREWQEDLPFGFLEIRCKSIKNWELICNTTFNEF